MTSSPDAVVIGSGPNGLAAAVILARAGLAVEVLEAQSTIGGGARTLDLGLADGLVHDLCSAVHPMAVASPFFTAFDLPARGVELRNAPIAYAQPMDGGRAGLAYQSLEETVEGLGADGATWRRLFEPLVQRRDAVLSVALGDMRHVPRDLVTAARFGIDTLDQGTPLWNRRFRRDTAPALLSGVAMHAIAPMPSLASAGAALLLASLAHGDGWPIPVGGSQSIVDAMVADLAANGGQVHPDRGVHTFADLPQARAYLFDTTPWTMASVLGNRLPDRVARAYRRFKPGNAAAKVDFVINAPVPWANREVGRAGTVHLGGTRADLAAAERDVARGRHAQRPAVLLSDPTIVDPSRAAGALRPLWTYAHVPAGSDRDVTEDVTRQIERFAPGFRDTVVASRCVPAAQMSEHNANYVGGDIAAGAVTIPQVLARPRWAIDPYSTDLPGVYLCSASTPPGPGVHGLCGANAAQIALREVFGITRTPSLAP